MQTKFQRILFSILLLGYCAAVIANNPGRKEGDALSFGVVPQQSAKKSFTDWAPVIRRLEELTGQTVNFRTAPDIPTFEDRLSSGEYDIAYMNPYHYTRMSRLRPGYRAIARARDKKIQGVIVVHQDSPIESLSDLQNSTIAFPSPAAFAASILPRAELVRKGIAFKSQYVASHDSVYLSVARGLYVAGGGVVRTLNRIRPDVRQVLRVLWRTDDYTPHAIAVRGDLPKSLIDRLQMGFVELCPQGECSFMQGLGMKGFEAAEDADWDDIRSLEIDTVWGSGARD